MSYKGVEYYYAFEFKIPVEDSGKDRLFRVVISKYRENSMDFSGLCLENELRVVSEEKIPFEAFFDIINSIVDITVESEREYTKANPGETPAPLLKVEDADFLSKFEERKKSRESLEYYEQLRPFFERQWHILNGTARDAENAGLLDHLHLMSFLYLVPLKAPKIKDPRVFII